MHDVGEREQLGPVDVLDAVYEDEDDRKENECHPEHEIVEKRPICRAHKGISVRESRAGGVQDVPEVRGRVSPAKIMNTENQRTYGI